MKLSVRAQTQRGQARLHRIGEVSKPRVLDRILKAVAGKGVRRLMKATPKGLTGRTRAAWRVLKTGSGYTVTNIHGKVVLFLDEGTRAHGPVRAKFLFIALTRRAALNGWSPSLRRGVDYILVKRVRGIRALHFVHHTTDWMREQATKGIREYIRDVAKR